MAEFGEAAAGVVGALAIAGVGADGVGDGHGADAELVEHGEDVEAAFEGLGVLDGEHGGDLAGGLGGLDVGGGEGQGDLVGVGLEFGVEPAEAIQHVGQVVAPGAGVVDGEVAGVQAALVHGGEVGLDGDFGGVGGSAQVGDQALRLGSGRSIRPGHALSIAADEADDGVVVGVDDEGVAVEGLPVVVGGHGLGGGGWGGVDGAMWAARDQLLGGSRSQLGTSRAACRTLQMSMSDSRST